jgi:hypothetical protein
MYTHISSIYTYSYVIVEAPGPSNPKICFLTLAEKAYPRRFAFDYLDDLQKEFLQLRELHVCVHVCVCVCVLRLTIWMTYKRSFCSYVSHMSVCMYVCFAFDYLDDLQKEFLQLRELHVCVHVCVCVCFALILFG